MVVSDVVGETMKDFFHAAETFVIRLGSLALLVILVYNLIRNELKNDSFSRGEIFAIVGSLALLMTLVYKILRKRSGEPPTKINGKPV